MNHVLVAILVLVFAAAPQAGGASFGELFKEGLLALQRNDLVSAERSLRSASEVEPHNGRVWVALAQTYRKRDEFSKAEESAQKAAHFGAEDPAVLEALSIYFSESGQLLPAAKMRCRNLAAACFEALQPLLEQQKFSDVVALFDTLSPDLKADAHMQLALGVAYYGLRRFEESAGALITSISLEPSVKQPYIFLGKMLDQIPSHLDQAIDRFLELQKNNPTDYEGYLLQAKALNVRAVGPDTTRRLLDKVIALQPQNAEAHYELGSLLDRTQHFADAALEFEKASALDPADASTHYRLSRLYQRLNRPEAALAEREQHRKMMPAQNAER